MTRQLVVAEKCVTLMIGILIKNQSQVTFASDQHPVQALAAER
jgi:hypothetical protein